MENSLEADNAFYCLIHDTVEAEESEEFFRQCGVCGHCYKTEEDLIDEDYKILMETRERVGSQAVTKRKVDDIFTCPHCIHNF